MNEMRLLASPFLLVLLLVPGIVLAAPVLPGSTPEYQGANKAHIVAPWKDSTLPGFAPTPDQAAKNRQAASTAWPTVLRLMPEACAKNDALACETIATSESLYSRSRWASWTRPTLRALRCRTPPRSPA